MILGVFMVLTVTIVYQMGLNYDVSSDRLDPVTTGALDKDAYEVELGEVDEDASQYRERFESGDVDDVDDPSGIFTILGDLVGIITTPFKILSEIGTNVLHFPTILVNVLLAIINIAIIFGIWSVIRKGS